MRKRTWTQLLVAFALCTTSCGRTGLWDDPAPPPAEAAPADAGQARAPPLFVFTGTGCPERGTESDLLPEQFDELAVVRFRGLDECSGAGGEWLVGRDAVSSRHLLAGAHACYFLPPEIEDWNTPRFGVVRFRITAGLFHAPLYWCVTDEEGKEVSTDARSISWGVYPTEAAARAALEWLRDQA